MEFNVSFRKRQRKTSEPFQDVTATESDQDDHLQSSDYEIGTAVSDVRPQSEIVLSPSTLDKPHAEEESSFQAFTAPPLSGHALGSLQEEDEEEEQLPGAGTLAGYRVDSEVVLTPATLEDDGASLDTASGNAGQEDPHSGRSARNWSPPRSFFADPDVKLTPEVIESRRDPVQSPDENLYSFTGTLMRRKLTPSITPSPSSEALDRLLAQSVARDEDPPRGPFRRVIGCFKDNADGAITGAPPLYDAGKADHVDAVPSQSDATPSEGSLSKKQRADAAPSIGPYVVRFHVPVEDLETFVIDRVRRYSAVISDSDSLRLLIDGAETVSSDQEPLQDPKTLQNGSIDLVDRMNDATGRHPADTSSSGKENQPIDVTDTSDVSPLQLQDDGYQKRISFTVNGVSIFIVIPTGVIHGIDHKTSEENSQSSVVTVDFGSDADRAGNVPLRRPEDKRPMILITVPREVPARTTTLGTTSADGGDPSTTIKQPKVPPSGTPVSDATPPERRRKNAVPDLSRSSTSSSEFDPASLYRKLQALARESTHVNGVDQGKDRPWGRGRSQSMIAVLPSTSSALPGSQPYTEESENEALAHLSKWYSSFQHGSGSLGRHSAHSSKAESANKPSSFSWFGRPHELQSIQETAENRGEGDENTPNSRRRFNVGRSVSMSAAPIALFRRRSSAAASSIPSGHHDKVGPKVSKSSSSGSYHTLREPRRSMSGFHGRPRSASQCSGMSFWDRSDRSATTGRRTRQLSMEIGEEWEGAQLRPTSLGENESFDSSLFGGQSAGAWSAGNNHGGGRRCIGSTTIARRQFRERLRAFMFPEIYDHRALASPSPSLTGTNPRSGESPGSSVGTQQKGGGNLDSGCVNQGYSDEASDHARREGAPKDSMSGLESSLSDSDLKPSLMSKEPKPDSSDISGSKEKHSKAAPDSCSVPMEWTEKTEPSPDAGARGSSSSRVHDLLSLALCIDRDAVARQKPNPYNDINHKFHSALHCPCFFFFCLVCCSPGVYFMQKSDKNFVKGNDHLAKTQGRRATAFYIVGTIIGFALLAIMWTLVYLFIIVDFLQPQTGS